MKKFISLIIVLFFIALSLSGCKNNSDNNNSVNNSKINIFSDNNVSGNVSNYAEPIEVVKEEISSFRTKLTKDYSDKDRDSNIELACSTLDGTIVDSKETFSFWDTIGNPTEAKGYKKAKAFDSDGDIIEAYGGGLCQLSTTLYNAILELDDFNITERHPHSNEVPYISEGKDAAVSFNSSDLKFKNNSDYNIEIKAEIIDNEVEIKILKF